MTSDLGDTFINNLKMEIEAIKLPMRYVVFYFLSVSLVIMFPLFTYLS